MHRPTAHILSSSTRVEPQATRFYTHCTRPLTPLLAEGANIVFAPILGPESRSVVSQHFLGDGESYELSCSSQRRQEHDYACVRRRACSLLRQACAELRWKCMRVSLLLVKRISSYGSCSYSFHERGVFPCRLEL
jgi:hypothetical protein